MKDTSLIIARSVSSLQRFLYLLIAAFVLLWPAIWNGYPLVFSDTGTYIASAFEQNVPFDRPIGYGDFIQFFSQGISLWLVVYAQAFFAVYLLWQVVKMFFEKKHYTAHFLLTVVLALYTTLPWMTSQIMPDIFTGLLFLIVVVFVFAERSWFERFVLIVLMMIFLITHTANFVLCVAMLVVMGCVVLLFKTFKNSKKTYLLRLATMLVVSLFGPAFFIATNYHEGYGITVSPSSSVFMMARMSDAGIIQNFLAEHCGTETYYLCKFQTYIPSGETFLWDDKSPTNLAGWKSVKDEYQKILSRIFAEPKYLLSFAFDSFGRSARLFFMTGLESYMRYGEAGPIYIQVKKYFPHELAQYIGARQYQGFFESVTGFYVVFSGAFYVSAMFILFMVYRKETKFMETWLFAFVFVFLVLNAVLLATLSGDYGRYQERVVWLMGLCAAMICLKKLFKFKV